MGKLVFRVAADYQEVIKLRTEIEKLKQTLLTMNKNRTPGAVEALEVQLGTARKRMDELVTSGAKAGAEMEHGFKKKIFDASQSVNDFTQKIITQKNTIKGFEQTLRAIQEEYGNITKSGGRGQDRLDSIHRMKNIIAEEKDALFGLTQEQANARLSVSKLRQEYALYKDDSVKVVSANDDIVGSMKQFILTIAGADAIKSFISNVVEVTGNFQKMEAVLGNTLGSTSKAKETMDMLADFGAKTPFQVDELTSAYVKLANQGFTPTMNQMKKLGDLASSTGKSFDQLAEAIIDAQVGENERLKEFGIRASKNGDKVTYTFKEQETTIQNTASAIREYILSLGDLERVTGANEKISATFVGRLSNIQDELTNKLKNFGEQFNTELSGGINAAGLLVENLNSIIPIIGGLVTAYGAYKAAVIAVNAAHKAGALFDNIRLIGMARKELGLATAAQQAFNVASKANIYATLISVLIGLGTAVYMFSQKTKEATDSQKRLSDTSKDLHAELSKETHIIDKLFGDLKKAKEGTKEYDDAKQKILDNYGKYLSGMNTEIATLKNQKGAYDAVTEAIKRNITEKMKEKFINEGVGDSSAKQAEALKALREKIYKDVGEDTGQALFESIKDTLSKNNPDDYLGIVQQLKQAGVKDDAFGYGKVITDAIVNFKNAEKDIKQVFKDAEDLFTPQEDKSTKIISSDVKKEIEAATKNISTLKQSIADLRSGKTQVEVGKTVQSVIETKVKELKAAEESLATLTGVDKKSGISSNTLKSEQSDRLKAIEEFRKSMSDAEVQSEFDIRQQRIDAMEAGSKKTLAQIDLEYDRRMEANRKRANDMIKERQELERKQWEYDNPKWKEKGMTFKPTTTSVTQLPKSQQKQLLTYDKIAAEANKKAEEDYQKSLLEKYQDYTDKRLAIEKKFNDDLAVLDEQRKVAVEKGDIKQVEQIDRSKAQATANKGKELMGLDYEKMKESPEYVRAFENLKETSSETLDSLLSQFEKAKQTAAQVLSPDQLREYTTTIQSIMDELNERNPFQALADRKKELVEAENELVEAKRQLDLVNGGGKIVTGVKNSKLESGKISFENTYLSSAEALVKYNEAKDKAAKASNRYQKAEKEVSDVVDKLFTSIKDVGSTIGGTSGEVLSFIGDIGLFVTSSINAWETAASAGSKAVQAVEKASVILAVISTVIQLMEKLSSLSKSAYEQYEAFAEKVKEINLLTDAVNEYRIAALEAQQVENNWFSKDNLQNLRDYRKLHEEVVKTYYDKAGEEQAIYQNQKGGGWLTGGLNGIMNWLSPLGWSGMWQKWTNQNYKEGTTAAIDNLRIETRKKSKGFLGSGIGAKSQKTEDLATWAKNQGLGDLFDKEGLLDKELAQSLIDNYGDKLVGQTKETLEELIKLRERYDEYLDQLHEYVSSLYEPLVDNFVDSLWDWLDTGKDALASFKEYASDTFRDIVSDMMRSIVLSKVVDGFDKQVSDLYEKYAKGDIDEQELMKQVAEKTGELVDRYEQNMPTLQGILGTVNGYFKDAGIDLKDRSAYSQSSSKAVSVTASQDSIDETNGRLTGIQMAEEEIKAQNISQSESLNILTVKADAILSVNAETRNIADEIRTIQVNSYLELQEIRQNTGDTVKQLKSMDEKLKSIENNTKNM